MAYARLLVHAAHSHGLAIAQKNTSELSGTLHSDVGFDFAIAEECSVYDECDQYTDAYGGEVFEVEYTDNDLSAYRKACADHGARISVILRDRDVVAAGQEGYHNESC